MWYNIGNGNDTHGGNMKKLEVWIRSDDMPKEDLEYVKDALESQEGWQITGHEEGRDDFHCKVTIME